MSEIDPDKYSSFLEQARLANIERRKEEVREAEILKNAEVLTENVAKAEEQSDQHEKENANKERDPLGLGVIAYQYAEIAINVARHQYDPTSYGTEIDLKDIAERAKMTYAMGVEGIKKSIDDTIDKYKEFKDESIMRSVADLEKLHQLCNLKDKHDHEMADMLYEQDQQKEAVKENLCKSQFLDQPAIDAALDNQQAIFKGQQDALANKQAQELNDLTQKLDGRINKIDNGRNF